MSYGQTWVKCTSETNDGEYVTIRVFTVTDANGGSSQVKHFHYLGFPWDDMDAPASPRGVLRVIALESEWRNAADGAGPTLVHCSSGVGRTGVYLAIAESIVRLDEGDDEVDVFQLVSKLRTKRVAMVQTTSQYRFLYDAIAEYIKK